MKVLFKTKINDLPCGFKAVNKKVRDKILPKITEEGFFWDTEMLILASRRGFNIKEIPVVWSEYVDPGRDSKVSIVLTIIDYIKKSISLRKRV